MIKFAIINRGENNMYNLTGRWKEILREESKKDYFHNMIKWIENDERKHKIFPKKENWYKALELCPYENTKVVILGQDPYHEEGQAHGLAFSVQCEKLPPSLINIFKEIENEYNIKISKESGNLENWARQGVLLLNTVLTVREHEANSHKGIGWEKFTDKIISELNEKEEPLIFMLWGNNAKEKKKLITNKKHHIIENSHPSPLSANRSGWFNEGQFLKANSYLKDKIKWWEL